MDITMDFAEFVKRYWKKIRPSKVLWNRDTAAEDSGLPVALSNVYFDFCANEPADATDDQIIQKFQSTVYLKVTPFGYVLLPISPQGEAPTVGNMHPDELIANIVGAMKTLLGK